MSLNCHPAFVRLHDANEPGFGSRDERCSRGRLAQGSEGAPGAHGGICVPGGRVAIPRAWFLLLVLFCCWDARATEFRPCNDAQSLPALQGSLCAVYFVPLRATGPGIGPAPTTIQLFVRKYPAQGHVRGTLWMIAGGPGESGATFYPFLDTLRRAFPGFDLVIPDHRGTGYSTHLCPLEEAIGSLGGALLVGSEWARCWRLLNSAPDYARAFTITNAARDLAFLLEQYGHPQPAYLYAESYGTQLVLRMLQLAQPPLEGLLLDSLVPPESLNPWDISHRSANVDAVGKAYLAECEADPRCRARFPGGIGAAFTQVLQIHDDALLKQIPGRNLKVFFSALLDYPSLRSRIPELIWQLQHGQTTEVGATAAALHRIIVSLEQFPQSPLSIPLVSIISSSENNARPTLTRQEIVDEQAQLLFATSLPDLLIEPGLPLYQRDAMFGQLPEHVPRTLVLQGTLDPKTPLDGARAHLVQLQGRETTQLLAVKDSPHFILMTSPDCVVQAAGEFQAGHVVNAPACSLRHFRPGY
jgi:pimeloyl-ACP methyl ester carboxylesterase